MSNTLLVGTDGSKCSSRALDFAAARAATTGDKLIIAYVIEWSPYSFNTPSENEMRHKRREEEISRAQKEVINPLVEKYAEQGIDVEGCVRHGHPANVLNMLADEFDASVVFVGRNGTSSLKSLIFGSVAGNLVQISDRPVTVVP
jgi:nucleotide-binding universal stress UspA family protein